MSARFTIRGGAVHTPAGRMNVDVRVREGLVDAVGPGLEAGGDIVDATGLWVLPGAVDAHVHSRDPGFPDKEDWASLTRAAAAGGVTTVVDMPNTVPATATAALLREKAELAASRAVVDFGLWGLLRSSSTDDQIRDLVRAGAIGLKAYLGYAYRRSTQGVTYSAVLDDPDLEPPPDYGTLARVAPVLAQLGAPLAAHGEDAGVLREFARPLREYADVLAARPAIAEALAIAALGVISQRTGVHVHVVHLSSAVGLAVAREARQRGARMTLETCPQYLWTTDADFERLGNALRMNPPVRTAADQAALRGGLLSGVIHTVGTDHAPHSDAEKFGVDLDHAHPGSPGVQTLLLSCLELDPVKAPLWVAEAPARLLGLYPRKGAIVAGADADLVLVDPAAATVASAESMYSKQKHAVLEGMRFRHSIRAVYSRGELVADGGRITAQAGRGRFLRPSARPA